MKGASAGIAGVREEVDTMDLVDQIIQIDRQRCHVKGRITCRNEELYGLESAKSLIGYNGKCPKCNWYHIRFYDPSKSFYVSVKSLHDKVNKDKHSYQ
jgi:hypothetical protein